MMRKILLAALFACVLVSALEIVLQRHEMRKVFVNLQELHILKADLNREWGQLLLEQGTWGTHGRVEAVAREKLEMTVPIIDDVIPVRS